MEGVAPDASEEEGEVECFVELFLFLGMAAAHDVAGDFAVLFKDNGAFGFEVGVVFCEVVGEEFAVLEEGIDGVAEVAGLAADVADGFAIRWFEKSNKRGHGDFLTELTELFFI